MKTSFIIGLAAFLAVMSSAQIIPRESNHDLRALQQLTAASRNFTAVCTTDALCNTASANYCCAQVARGALFSTTFTNVVKICMPYDMHGQNIVFNNQNYTFNCTTGIPLVQAYTAKLGPQCSGNAMCPGGCCTARTYTIWGQDASLPSYCLEGATAGNFFWANYKVGTAPNNITTDLILNSRCYDNLPPVSGAYAQVIQTLLLAGMAFFLVFV